MKTAKERVEEYYKTHSEPIFTGSKEALIKIIEAEEEYAKSVSEEKHYNTKVVCFCGSTRFANTFMIERWKLEKKGIITLGINILPNGYFIETDHHGAEQEGVKDILDELHKRKIDIADEVVILNVDGYIGKSTQSELDYALSKGKKVTYLEPVQISHKEQ